MSNTFRVDRISPHRTIAERVPMAACFVIIQTDLAEWPDASYQLRVDGRESRNKETENDNVHEEQQ